MKQSCPKTFDQKRSSGGFSTSSKTVRDMEIRPHVSQNVKRNGGSAIDARTTRHDSYAVSQRKRPLIEKVFGWMKQTGGLRKTKLRGLGKVAWQFVMTAAAFNLWRLPKLTLAGGVTGR
jgi:hypothetical protein